MVINQFDGQLIFAVFWGLFLITSFAGYGWLLARSLRIPLHPSPLAEFGLYAGWGLSVWIAIGGAMAFLSLISPVSIMFLLAGGICPMIYALVKYPYKFSLKSRGVWTLVIWAGLILGAFTLYVLHASNYLYNPNDDLAIYNVFPQEMLQTGTLIEPFSWRRMTAYGGQSFMQAACMCALPPPYMNLFDRGICALLSFILVANMVWAKKLEKTLVAALLVVVWLLVPSPAVNVSSEESGLFLILVLVASCEKLYSLNIDTIKRGLILGLVASAYYTLKAQHLISVVFFFGFIYLFEIIRTRKAAPSLKEAFLVLLFCLCFLSPWARIQYISSGTMLYPIFHGNQPVDYAPIQLDAPFFWKITWITTSFSINSYVYLSLFAMAMANELAERKVVVPLNLTAMATCLAISFVMANKTDADVAVYRYCFGPLIAATFLSLLCSLESAKKLEELPSPDSKRLRGDADRSVKRLALALLFLFVVFNFSDIEQDLSRVERNGLQNYCPGPWTDEFKEYRNAQNAVPPGKSILVYTDYPFLFDFKRNPVFVGDIPGSSSPPPFMPFFQGPQALVEYLDAVGIDYVIHSDFDAPGQILSHKYALYSKAFWTEEARCPYPVWRAHAPYFIDELGNLQLIEKDRNPIHDAQLTSFSLHDMSSK